MQIKEQLKRGTCTSVVVCDLSHDTAAFETHFGHHMSEFVRGGGRVAFPCKEGGQIVSTLARLFGVEWQPGGHRSE